MNGRLLITLVVLALAAAACAEPGVVSGDDANQESESVTEDPESDDTSATEETTSQEPADQTTPTTSNKSPLVTNPPKEPPATTTTTNPSETSPGVDPGLLPLVDQAKADLAERLSIGADLISLREARGVTWPDTSLGCPQPGMAYNQVLTPGLMIRLSAAGQMYSYHSGGGREPFMCEQTSVIPEPTPKADEFVPPPDSEID